MYMYLVSSISAVLSFSSRDLVRETNWSLVKLPILARLLGHQSINLQDKIHIIYIKNICVSGNTGQCTCFMTNAEASQTEHTLSG